MRRAFTMIELMVSIVAAIVVLGAVMDLLIQATVTRSETEAKANLGRDADLLSDIIERDLAAVGLGVPRGSMCTNAGTPFTSAPFNTGVIESHQLRPPVRIGLPDMLAFIGDVPYPNAEFPGVSRVVEHVGDHIAITNELMMCPPKAGADDYLCDVPTNSFLSTPSALSGTDLCTNAQRSARTCPWSNLKFQNDATGHAYVVASDARGRCWYPRRFSVSDTTRLFDSVKSWAGGIHLEHEYPTAGEDSIDDPNTFFDPVGGGFIAQLDRVFYTVENPNGTPCTQGSGNCVLLRRQCWGFGPAGNATQPDDPGAALFPGVRSTAVRSTATPLRCGAGDGTGWEPIVNNIERFAFRYFGSDRTTHELVEITWDGSLARAAQVSAVEVSFTLRRDVRDRPLRQEGRRMLYLENAGGILNASVANGGCVGSEC